MSNDYKFSLKLNKMGNGPYTKYLVAEQEMFSSKKYTSSIKRRRG